MKKWMRTIIAFALFFSLTCAYAEDAHTIFFPFHLGNKTTYDEVVQSMTEVFGNGEEETGDYREGDYVIKPTAKLYGFDIDAIHISKGYSFGDIEQYAWAICFQLDIGKTGKEAEDVGIIYNKLIEIYGNPLGLSPITINYDFEGKQSVYSLINQKQELQQTINKAREKDIVGSNSFFYTLYWENCRMQLYFSDYSSQVEIAWKKYGEAEGIFKDYMSHSIDQYNE